MRDLITPKILCNFEFSGPTSTHLSMILATVAPLLHHCNFPSLIQISMVTGVKNKLTTQTKAVPDTKCPGEEKTPISTSLAFFVAHLDTF